MMRYRVCKEHGKKKIGGTPKENHGQAWLLGYICEPATEGATGIIRINAALKDRMRCL